MSLILGLLIIFIYFIPSFVAWEKKNCKGIFILNLFLGWTLIGWIGALIWAVSDKKY